jgi:hypothetical protein
MFPRWSTIVLWLFVLNLGIAFGAGLYEHRIVVSRWVGAEAEAGPHWNAEAARQDDTGRRFWVFVTTVPLTLLTLANLFAAWQASGPVRHWWLATALVAVAERLFTFGYFIPTMVGLMNAADSPESTAAAVRWWHLNYLRHGLVLITWLSALRTFALVHTKAAA